MLYDAYNHSWGPTTRPQYNRAPYVRVTLPDGRQLDGRATAWTTNKVHATWHDPDSPPRTTGWTTTHVHGAWMDAHHAHPIKRSESSRQARYDDLKYFEDQGEL